MMTTRIKARLDDETARICDELRAMHGWTNSEIVRRAIHILAGKFLATEGASNSESTKSASTAGNSVAADHAEEFRER